MKQAGLIELSDCKILIEIDKADQRYLGITLSDHFVIFRRQHFNIKSNKFLKNQLEIPVSALKWVIDTIEIGFGKNPDDGGLPRDVLHDQTVIEGEEINLRRTMNCGAANQQGYTLSNFSRDSYIDKDDCQSIQLPDYLLFDEGLLEKLKDLARPS